MHYRNDGGRKILSRVPFKPPRGLPTTKITPRGGMLGTIQAWLPMPEGTASAKIIDKFNKKIPKMTDQSQTSKPVAKREYDDFSSEQVYARQVHSPSISNSTLDSTVPPAPIAKNIILMKNQVTQIPTSNRYTNLYYYDS